MWQSDSLHPLSVHFFERMMVRSRATENRFFAGSGRFLGCIQFG